MKIHCFRVLLYYYFACLYMPKAAVSIRLTALAHAGSPQEDVRNFAMNYAMRCFEFISSVQGLSDDDRGICSSELFRAFRRPVDSKKIRCFSCLLMPFEDVFAWFCLVFRLKLGSKSLRGSLAVGQQGLARTFASDPERRAYEELWLGLVDQALSSLPELRSAAQSTSKARFECMKGGYCEAQAQLERLQNFRNERPRQRL